MSKTPKMRPSYETRKPLRLAEHPPTDQDQRTFIRPGINSYFRRYSLGECSVIVTREYGKWHLSIAHPHRYPTWDEIAEARYRLLPDGIVVAMILPPKQFYINIHRNCFQMHEIDDSEGFVLREPGGSTS